MTSKAKSPDSKTAEKEIEPKVPDIASIAPPSRPVPCCRLPKEPKFVPSASETSTETKSENEKVEKVEKVAVEDTKAAKQAEKLENPTVVVKDAGLVEDSTMVLEDAAPVEEPEPVPPVVPTRAKRSVPTIEKSSNSLNPSNVAVPRNGSSRAEPVNLDERPLVMATHLVPSLPVALFEILAEVIEVATGKAVSLIYEPRFNRPVAKDLVDIAILPASDSWIDGSLLPVGIVFEHRLNKDKSPAVYVDVVVAPDCIRNVEAIIDLRGYRCALPDRRKTLGAAGLLFSHLKSKGEGPTFFGNTLDSGSQVTALQMVAGKQAEVGVLESPVINYHKNTLPGVDSLYRLASLGPLPPYRIMLNKNLEASLREKIKEGLLNVERDVVWMDKLKTFGVIGFAEYSEDKYTLEDVKNVVTSVPYY